MPIDEIKVEEDIEITLKDDESEEEGEESIDSPEASQEGEAPEEKEKVEEESLTKDELKSREVEDPKYKGKTREQVIEMHLEAEKKIGSQGDELGKVRAKEKGEKEKNLVEEMSIDELKEAHKRIRVKMAKLDPEYDKDEYEKLANAVAESEQDILDKRHSMFIQEKFTSTENKEFVEKQKSILKGKGYFVDKDGNFNDDEYNATIDQAKNYIVNGRLTENSIFKAMVDLHGIEKISKIIEVGTEQSTRKKIQEAAGKVDNKIDSKGKGSETDTRKVFNLSKMTSFERETFLDGLSIEELNVLTSALEKKRK